jgi:hypothetical protein
MASIKFKAGNAWALLRAMEYAATRDTKSAGLTDSEMDVFCEIMSGCLIHQESGLVKFREVSVDSLWTVMKVLSNIAYNADKLVGERNAPRCAAQARSLRTKLLEIRTKLDLTGRI